MTVISTGQDGGHDPRKARIQLVTGEMFSVLAPEEELMNREAFACGVANACRFGGQVRPFYSVAQHSVLVALLAPDDMPAQKFALLHDGEEGFALPDLVTPAKPFFPAYVEAQALQSEALFRHHGVDASLKPRVKPFDVLALSIEKRDLKCHREGYLNDLPRPPADIHVEGIQPAQAEILMLAAYDRVFVDHEPVTREWLAQIEEDLGIATGIRIDAAEPELEMFG